MSAAEPLVIFSAPALALSRQDLEESVERGWRDYNESANELLASILTLMADLVREDYPEAVLLVLREDISHLPAHGHVDDIVSRNGQSVMPAEWHDAEGNASHLDDLAWEAYHVGSNQFTPSLDHVRRLFVRIPQSSQQ